MDFANILNALGRERQLLAEFLRLSHREVLLPARSTTEDVEYLLACRSDLMAQLTEIHAAIGAWISHIHVDSFITAELLDELRATNSEIVRLANDVVEIDERILQQVEEWGEDAPDKLPATANAKATVKIHIV